MKLKYEFEIVSIGDDIVAVPIGDSSDTVQGVIRLNHSAVEIFEMLKTEISQEAIIEKLSEIYENDKVEITSFVKETVNEFIQIGILSTDV